MSKEMKSREFELNCRGCLNCDMKDSCKHNILVKVNQVVDESGKEIKKHNNDKTFEWGWKSAVKHIKKGLSDIAGGSK